MAAKFRQLDEALDYVFEASKKEEQVERFKEIASKDQTVVPLVNIISLL